MLLLPQIPSVEQNICSVAYKKLAYFTCVYVLFSDGMMETARYCHTCVHVYQHERHGVTCMQPAQYITGND